MTVLQSLQDALTESLVGTGEGDTRVLAVQVQDIEDLNGLGAWRLVLFLPRPEGDEWDVESTSSLKRRARYRVEEIAADLGESRDGITSVVLATQEASADDTAAEDEPVEGEASAASPDESEGEIDD